MLLAWFAFLFLLIAGLIQEDRPDVRDWNGFEVTVVCIVVLILLVIPIQLARYFREWRTR